MQIDKFGESARGLDISFVWTLDGTDNQLPMIVLCGHLHCMMRLDKGLRTKLARAAKAVIYTD